MPKPSKLKPTNQARISGVPQSMCTECGYSAGDVGVVRCENCDQGVMRPATREEMIRAGLKEHLDAESE